MPRPNGPRVIYSETGLARRIAFERQRQTPPWSLEGLAKRMTDAGCTINASAIYKIEKGDPPRRITVDELVALSTVFGMEIADLLLPPEAVFQGELKRLFEAYRAAQGDLVIAFARANQAGDAVKVFAAAHNPEWADLPHGPTERQRRKYLQDLLVDLDG